MVCWEFHTEFINWQFGIDNICHVISKNAFSLRAHSLQSRQEIFGKIGWVANVIFKDFPTLSISGKLGA